MEDPPATAAAARFSTQSTVAPSTSLSAHELIKEKQAGDLPAPPEDALASRDGQSPAEDEKEHDFREKGLATHEAEKAQDPYNSTVPEQHKSEEETVGEGEDESKYLSGAPLLVLVISLCLVTFLIGLDQMVIATAIPKITTEFHSLSQVGWYGSAYLLTTTSLQPNFGKVYTYFNVKYTFIAAMVIFELGSVCCAVAQGSVTLIVGRAIAGSGAAGLFSGGMTIVGYSVPLRKRAIYIAALSSMFGLSSIVGPILGGVFTDKLTWRWCFWINLPFGGCAIAVVLFFFKDPKRDFTDLTFRQKLKELDLPGAFFLISAIVCLLLALQWGGITYAWSDSKVWGCFIGFVLLLAIFIVIQFQKGDHATIPPRILGQRSIMAAMLTLLFLSMGIYTHIYYLPFYFQAVKGTTAEQSGIRTVAYLISNTVSSLINGGLVTALGYYTPFIWLGTALFTVGAGLLHTLKVDSSKGAWIGYQILAGYGSGAAVQLPFIACQAVLSPKDMPSGNAIAIFANTLGGAIAISAAENVFSNTLVKQLSEHVSGVDPATVVAAGAQHIQDVVPKTQLAAALSAYNVAVTTAFILPVVTGGLAFLASLLFEWKSIKGKSLMAAAPA